MATNDAPSWLTPEETSAPPPEVPVAVAPSQMASMTNAQSEIDERELPGIILAMRLANMGVSIALMAVSVSFSVQRTRDLRPQHGQTYSILVI